MAIEVSNEAAANWSPFGLKAKEVTARLFAEAGD